MNGQDLHQSVIDTRGRLYRENPSYAICMLEKKGSAFKTLVSLADEAATAKARLSQTVATGHPLSSTLAGMNCAEAISSLLAFTAAYLSGGVQAKSGGPFRESVAGPELGALKADKRMAKEAAGQATVAAQDVLGLDDDCFQAFANFPGMQA